MPHEKLIPTMHPMPGDNLVRFVGDWIRFEVRDGQGRPPLPGWRAVLRTNIGRGDAVRREILQAHTRGLPIAGGAWRDLPMRATNYGWELEIPLAETGYFRAKAYLVDARGWQHWPGGPDVGISVHPDQYRTGNVIYCAWSRLFGSTRRLVHSKDQLEHPVTKDLEKRGYAVLPPSGTFRDLREHLPHIFGDLGCRILHLLPVNPSPTTYARFGQYGSPYAALDLKAVDPALVVFDKRTTGVDQFRELAYAVHERNGRLILDIVINHTGWGSVLQENRPEWFLRNPDGSFASPGAWGTTWEDLVELKHHNVELWDELAEVFLTWCRRGVDGFRCDAGYKVPVPAWQYIIARVQQEFPDALFLLEGLGGAWEATAALLTEGGMQWAYSELFQNYDQHQVASYLDHALEQCQRTGLLVHYSETHDNERLAARGKAWALLRNQLCALTSANGGFGYTCGVEWLATEKIRVHGSTGLAWDSQSNLVPELRALAHLLKNHPCFFDGASIKRLNTSRSAVLAWLRRAAESQDVVLVLVNTDSERAHTVELSLELEKLELWKDLLGQPTPEILSPEKGTWHIRLGAGQSLCLSATLEPTGLSGESYREARARAAWALQAMHAVLPTAQVPNRPWQSLSAEVDQSPADFLASLSELQGEPHSSYAPVVEWGLKDLRRRTPVPPGHWLLVTDTQPFRANLRCEEVQQHVVSIRAGRQHVACFPPKHSGGRFELRLERYGAEPHSVQGEILYLEAAPATRTGLPEGTDNVLLVNGRGGMARICVDLGQVQSKYDAVLAANLHPQIPVDRHVFVKRLRAWASADGFISPLDIKQLRDFQNGPPAQWDFVANAGDGRVVQVQLRAAMLRGRNTTVFQFSRPSRAEALGKQLPEQSDVRLTVRLDIEDRNFHCETKYNGAADHHFRSHTHFLPAPAERESSGSEATLNGHGAKDLSPSGTEWAGFVFAPAGDRTLRAYADQGCFHPQEEWSLGLAHPNEQSRGQEGHGDAFSPGWFELPLAEGAAITLVVTADAEPPNQEEIQAALAQSAMVVPRTFEAELSRAVQAFVVRRAEGKTVIAGYPWFLDWGRDTLICARGLLAAGMQKEVRQILLTFARFEDRGTLPNTIHGEDASNRDTSDAPLWFAVVCEEAAQLWGEEFLSMPLPGQDRSLRDVLRSIAVHYLHGTPNGIRADAQSGLVWSPAHFTWMDTNYPAATPREGYPISIQALWARFLRFLGNLGVPPDQMGDWDELADRVLSNIEKLCWLEDRGYYADVLRCRSGTPASRAIAEDTLRSNYLFLITLDLVRGERARRAVQAAQRWLVVPGALRTLAPLPVKVPVPVYGNNGGLLNDPNHPYWGRYEGDEDTRRKPAYHNGTAWTWTFPVFCEALAMAHDFRPPAVAAAKAYLGSMRALMDTGCLGQLPEILDGDAPHQQRGCDAQSWGATEALRVLRVLEDGRRKPAV